MTDLVTLSFEDFEPFIHQRFQVRFNTEDILDAELIELVRLDKYDNLQRQPFSFVLRTNQINEYYPQATFIIIHPDKGELPIFLVPLGPDNTGMSYQAIFN